MKTAEIIVIDFMVFHGYEWNWSKTGEIGRKLHLKLKALMFNRTGYEAYCDMSSAECMIEYDDGTVEGLKFDEMFGLGILT